MAAEDDALLEEGERTPHPTTVIEDPENLAGTYRPQDLDEQRRSWLIEEAMPRFSHLGPAEFVVFCGYVERFLKSGELPPKTEIAKEQKGKPVPQLRSV